MIVWEGFNDTNDILKGHSQDEKASWDCDHRSKCVAAVCEQQSVKSDFNQCPNNMWDRIPIYGRGLLFWETDFILLDRF